MKKSIKQKALEHYDRMIAWAKIQNQKERSDEDFMLDEIGENWFGYYCPYCKKYYDTKDCPLAVFNDIDSNCGDRNNCCDGKWGEMVDSLTWKDWIKAVKKVKDYIKKKG